MVSKNNLIWNGKGFQLINQIKGNQFISNKKSRFLFQLPGVDLEQLEMYQEISLIEGLKSDLNQINPELVTKIYHLDQKMYLDSELNKNCLSNLDSEAFLGGMAPFSMGKNVYSDPLFKGDYCKLNGEYLRFISVSFKEDHEILINGLQQYGEYFLAFQKIKTQFSKSLVNNARKMNHSSLYQALSDIEGIEAYQENEEMLKSIINKEEELFRVEIYFVIRSLTELDFQEKTKVVVAALNDNGLCPRIETVSLNHVFKMFCPGSELKLEKSLLFHTSLLANSLPLGRDKLMEDGVTFHTRSQNEVYFDTRTGDSFSMAILGVTGKGKTFFTQKILDYDLSLGRSCFVIDPKEDYKKFALLKNAYIIDESINPMIFKDATYLKNMILSKIPKLERSSLFEGKLLRAIRETKAYECKNFFKALELLKPVGFVDLEYYFEDIIEKISEEETPLNDFTYINFDSFGQEAIPFLLSFSFEYVKRLNKPYNLVIDEAHRIFKHDPTFLEERVREMRVQNASLFTLTQKYSDLVETYFGEVVADNSFHKFFFNQNIKIGSGIDDFDQEKIMKLRTVQGEYSEFYYKSENYRKVMRFYPTLKEFEVYKSGNEERDLMLEYIREKQRYFSVDEAINQWVRDKYAL
jgi:hypothetical protein